MVPLEQCVQWHEYKSQDPGIRWLRRLIQKAGRAIDPQLSTSGPRWR